MKNLLLTVILLCFCLPFVKAADQKMILISTNETDLILQVAPNGRLYQTYLGNKLVNGWQRINPWMGSISLLRSGRLFRTGFRHPA